MKTRQAAWTAHTIGAFIAQPQAEVPGTYMPYAGLRDAGERQSVTCFLAGLK
ncbi:Cytochrome c2 precursor [compost metagenome]